MTGADLLRFTPKYREDESGCWTWAGSLSYNGYGKFRYNGIPRMAHRVAYEHYVGAIPAGLDLDHLCRNRACVNPAHLEPVTRRENLLRGDTLTASYAARTHCQNGHALTEDNLVGGKERAQGRRCLTCCRERMRLVRATA